MSWVTRLPLATDRHLILISTRKEDNNNRFVPFAGKSLLEVQNFDASLDAEVQSRWNQGNDSAACIS
jgi:hypothetical protein